MAEPSRIERLVAALDEDPGLGLVGSSVTLTAEDGSAVGVAHMPEDDLDIRWTILFHNPFYHSSVMFRRELFDKAGGYRPEELVSQDHYLWFQMLPLCRARNIAEPLTRYRVNPRGLTILNAANARARTHAIRHDLWGRIGLVYDLYDDEAARDLTEFLRGSEIAPARRARSYARLVRVLGAFLAAQAHDARAARRLASRMSTRIAQAPPPGKASALAIRARCWGLRARLSLRSTLTAAVAAWRRPPSRGAAAHIDTA